MDGYEIFVRLIADGLLVPIVLIGAYELLFKVPRGQRYEAYCRVVMAGLTAYLIASFGSVLYTSEVVRPFQEMNTAAGALFLNNAGFPSDHTLFAAAITAAVWFETRRKFATYVLAILTIVLAVGRVLALVHTVTDVVWGVIFALVGALWYLNVPKSKRSVSR